MQINLWIGLDFIVLILMSIVAYTKQQTKMYLNTGWSSSLNKYSRKLLTQEALLVTAHGQQNTHIVCLF